MLSATNAIFAFANRPVKHKFVFANFSMADNTANPGICERIAKVRHDLHGPRGRAAFAKQLGISASTYNYYESGRVPPAELLVRIADAGGVDLGWLLTGVEARPAVPADHPAVVRIAALLADHPDTAAPLTAFVDLLSESLKWPVKPAVASGADDAGDGAAPAPPIASPAGTGTGAPAGTKAGAKRPAAASGKATPDADAPGTPARGEPTATPPGRRDWIPILGRSAAGVPQFWADDDDRAGLTHLDDLIARCASRDPAEVRPAVAADPAGRSAGVAQLVTLTEPDEADLVEFVVAADLKRAHPDAFALRIDGDSMSPEFRHGDVLVCSPSAPAADGRPAVVQLRSQIGVTCKLFRRAGDTIHLACVNERYEPQSFPASDCIWALRVLARIRPE